MSSVRERYGEAFWRAHHEAWLQSELNQREYCEAYGIPIKAFGNWRARFKAEPHPPARKVLYRRGGVSHALSHSLSHGLSHDWSAELEGTMDDDKSLLEKFTDTVKDAAHVVAEGAKAIAHPTSGTPMDMPLNESGYALTHPHFTPTPTADKVKKTAKKSAKKAAKKSPKKAVTKLATNKSKCLSEEFLNHMNHL